MRPFFAGVDVGSSRAKAVVIDGGGALRGRAVRLTGLDLAGAGRLALEEACQLAGSSRETLGGIVSTGYGRDDVPGAVRTRSEIMCVARGAFALLGRALTAVDIGAQDSKVVAVDGAGHRLDHRMNRRCAAGTGSFIELICLRMGIDANELGALAGQTTEYATLSSFCTVFAATEVLDLLRRGHTAAAIANGIYRCVAQRVADIGPRGPLLALCGGVIAHHPHLAEAMRDVTGLDVTVPENPQFAAALGAALLALDECRMPV